MSLTSARDGSNSVTVNSSVGRGASRSTISSRSAANCCDVVAVVVAEHHDRGVPTRRRGGRRAPRSPNVTSRPLSASTSTAQPRGRGGRTAGRRSGRTIEARIESPITSTRLPVDVRPIGRTSASGVGVEAGERRRGGVATCRVDVVGRRRAPSAPVGAVARAGVRRAARRCHRPSAGPLRRGRLGRPRTPPARPAPGGGQPRHGGSTGA